MTYREQILQAEIDQLKVVLDNALKALTLSATLSRDMMNTMAAISPEDDANLEALERMQEGLFALSRTNEVFANHLKGESNG